MFLSVSPVRALTKAILFPRGDQEGCVSGKEFLVSSLRPLPSAFITQISGSWLPSTSKALATKAIFLPSGDQVGSLSTTGVSVICLTPLPSAFMTEISELLRLGLLKAILEP